MKFVKSNIWSIVNSILLTIVAYMIINNGKEKIVYIDNVKLYKQFNMTKELGEINEKKYASFLTQFDSLVNKLNDLEKKLMNQKKITKNAEQEYILLKKNVIAKEEKIQNIRNQVQMEINKQVWERLNGYVRSFGEENNYAIVMGAQGKGNIMYSKEELNITDAFIEYANSKYEGN